MTLNARSFLDICQTSFPAAPLLVMAVYVAGADYDSEAVQGLLASQLNTVRSVEKSSFAGLPANEIGLVGCVGRLSPRPR